MGRRMTLKGQISLCLAAFFLALDRLGGVISTAAGDVGVNQNTAYRWAREAGVHGRGGGPHPRKQEYEQLRGGGMSRREAAARVGVHGR